MLFHEETLSSCVFADFPGQVDCYSEMPFWVSDGFRYSFSSLASEHGFMNYIMLEVPLKA